MSQDNTDKSSSPSNDTNLPADERNSSETPSAVEQELQKAKNDYLYLRADFDNYRKGVIKERSDLIKYGSERVFVELLNVLDNFERALQMEVTPETLGTFKEGIQLTANDLKKTLEGFGLSEVESLGQPFDPSLHEALSNEPTDRIPPGHITQVFKKAYKLHDRVIRHGQVVVAKAP